MNPLDELFMAETMTATVEEFAEQSEERSFIEVYEAGDRILPAANVFTYEEISYSRGMAPVTGPDSPTKARTPIGVKDRAARIYAVKGHVDLPATLLAMIRGVGQQEPDPEGWLNRNLQNLVNEINRTRNFWAAQSILTSNGQVDLSAFPNTDFPAGGGPVLEYPVVAVNAANSWAQANTLIRSAEINPLKRTYRRNVGFNCGRAIASDTVEGYITQNTELSNAVNGVQTLAQRKIETSYLEGGSLMNVGGIDFRFDRDYYVTDANQAAADAADSAATVTDVITDPDLVAILPPASRSMECFAVAEGRVFVPSGPVSAVLASADAGRGGAGLFSLIQEVRGWAAWLELIMNPIGVRLHVAWHGNFIQKRRRCVHVLNTTP